VNCKTIIVKIAGRAKGTRTRQRIDHVEAPSRRAASMTDRGAERKKALIQKIPNATETPTSGSITLQ
jgi:acetaldehyde dehydrogenase (acetylating)